MDSWAPSPKTQLTLRQLGFSAQQVGQVLARYREVSCCPNDKDFVRGLARLSVVDHAHFTALHRTAQLPLNWQPERTSIESLQSSGYRADALQHYRDAFVIRNREQGRVVVCPDLEFRRFCYSRPRQLPAPIPGNWTPSLETLSAIHRLHVPTDFVMGLVAEFVLYWKDVGRIREDWQSVFLKHTQNRWLRRGNAQPIGSTCSVLPGSAHSRRTRRDHG